MTIMEVVQWAVGHIPKSIWTISRGKSDHVTMFDRVS